MNIYIRNIDFKVTDQQLNYLFATCGAVQSAKVIRDKFTGRSKGFGFVEMPDDQEAEKAIASLNGYVLNNRPIEVSQARPREDRGNYSDSGHRR